MTRIKDIKGHEERKAVYALAHNKPSPLFSLSRRGVFKVGSDYIYRKDRIILEGEKALESVSEDVDLALQAFGYRKDKPVKTSGYSLTCDRDTMNYLRTMIKVNRWILSDRRA